MCYPPAPPVLPVPLQGSDFMGSWVSGCSRKCPNSLTSPSTSSPEGFLDVGDFSGWNRCFPGYREWRKTAIGRGGVGGGGGGGGGGGLSLVSHPTSLHLHTYKYIYIYIQVLGHRAAAAFRIAIDNHLHFRRSSRCPRFALPVCFRICECKRTRRSSRCPRFTLPVCVRFLCCGRCPRCPLFAHPYRGS